MNVEINVRVLVSDAKSHPVCEPLKNEVRDGHSYTPPPFRGFR
jgi:hypothetical protein